MAGSGVEVAGRLIGQDQRGPIDQSPGDRDSLLLPPGELIRHMAEPLPKPDHGQDLDSALPTLHTCETIVHRRQLDIFERAGARQQVEPLKDEADPLVSYVRSMIARQGTDLLALEKILA